MSKSINTVLTAILWVIIAVSMSLMLMLFSDISNEASTLFDTNLQWAYGLLGLGVVIILVFSGIHLIDSGKKSLKSIGAVIALACVVYLAYAMSSTEIPNWLCISKLKELGTPTVEIEETLKMADTYLRTTYFLLGAAFLSILSAPVFRLFK